jgi:hypothetical protein
MTENTNVQAEETVIKNSKDYIEFLETSEQDTFSKEEVLEVLKGFKVKGNGQRRGQLAGLQLADMSDEQLKRELVNAKSVLYKAQQREASQETIDKNQARVDAALEEKANRAPEVTEDTVADTTTDTDVYVDADTANEL